MTNETGNVKAATEFLTAMGDADVAKLDALLAEDLEYWVGGNFAMTGTHTKAAILQMTAGVGQVFPDGMALRPIGSTAEGDRVALEAAGLGKTVTGKVYDNRYHFLFVFDQKGKIKVLREYMDTGHAAEVFES